MTGGIPVTQADAQKRHGGQPREAAGHRLRDRTGDDGFVEINKTATAG
jgi:hypothetical protein